MKAGYSQLTPVSFVSSLGGAAVELWIAGIIRVVDCIGVAATRVVVFRFGAIVGVEGDLRADVYIPRRFLWKVGYGVRGIDKAKGLFQHPRVGTGLTQAFVVRAERIDA